MDDLRKKIQSSYKGNRVLFISIVIFALSTAFLAYSFSVTWNTQAMVNVYSPSLDLRVYWDQACTNPVTSIDFGNIQKSMSNMTIMYVRNEGNGTVYVYWNSTRASATTYITEKWTYRVYPGLIIWANLDGSSISAGQIFETQYRIDVASNCPSGRYSWTLFLGAVAI